MGRSKRVAGLALSLIAFVALTQPRAFAAPQNVRPDDGLYVNAHYDPTRNASVDLGVALARARAGGKRVLLEIGGDWCAWCVMLDQYINAHRDVREAFLTSFVIVKVNVDAQHPNAAFLASYPRIEGYPSLLILDGDGAFREAQDPTALQNDDGYALTPMVAFAHRWAPR